MEPAVDLVKHALFLSTLYVGATNYRSGVTLALALPCDGSSIVQLRAGLLAQNLPVEPLRKVIDSDLVLKRKQLSSLIFQGR